MTAATCDTQLRWANRVDVQEYLRNHRRRRSKGGGWRLGLQVGLTLLFIAIPALIVKYSLDRQDELIEKQARLQRENQRQAIIEHARPTPPPPSDRPRRQPRREGPGRAAEEFGEVETPLPQIVIEEHGDGDEGASSDHREPTSIVPRSAWSPSIIELPEGDRFDATAIAMTRGDLEALYDQAVVTYLEKYASGEVHRAYAMMDRDLDGPGAELHPDGQPHYLAFYRKMRLDGPLRIWDADGRPRLFCEYANHQKHGQSCLLDDDGRPSTIIVWEHDRPLDAYTVDNDAGPLQPPRAVRLDLESTDFKAAAYEFEQLEQPFLEHVNDMRREGRRWYTEEERAYEQAMAAEINRGRRQAMLGRRAEQRQQLMDSTRANWRASLRRLTAVN